MAGNSKINPHQAEDVLDGVLRGTACSSRNTTATTMTTMTSSTSGDMSLSSPRDLRGLYNCSQSQQQPPTTKHPPNFKHLLCPPSTTTTKASGTTNIKAVSVATTTSATHIKLGML